MKIAIIGTGNVGTALFKAFEKQTGIEKVKWYSRTPNEFQVNLNTPIDADVEVVVLAVPDDQIAKVANSLHFESKNTIVAHVSGATPSTSLSACGQEFGVIYPVQTIRKGAKVDWSIVPFCIFGNEFVTAKLFQLANMISHKVSFLDDDARLYLHLAAVIVNNFTNHLAVLTKDLLLAKGVEFSLLSALIRESALKITSEKPDFTQTGPAARGDEMTILRHKSLLSDHPSLLKVYQSITESIIEYQNKETK